MRIPRPAGAISVRRLPHPRDPGNVTVAQTIDRVWSSHSSRTVGVHSRSGPCGPHHRQGATDPPLQLSARSKWATAPGQFRRRSRAGRGQSRLRRRARHTYHQLSGSCTTRDGARPTPPKRASRRCLSVDGDAPADPAFGPASAIRGGPRHFASRHLHVEQTIGRGAEQLGRDGGLGRWLAAVDRGDHGSRCWRVHNHGQHTLHRRDHDSGTRSRLPSDNTGGRRSPRCW